jgi:hypothetical protein
MSYEIKDKELIIAGAIICFPSFYKKTMKLSKTARNLLDVFLLLMYEDNDFYLDSETQKNIPRVYKAFSGNDISEKTIRNVISELRQNELLIRMGNNAYLFNSDDVILFTKEALKGKILTAYS